MKDIVINIGWEDFSFTGEILFKHMRKIQPLSQKQTLWEIWELDFMLELAEILCTSKNCNKVKEAIDNLDMKWVEKFTKDFEKIANILNQEEEAKKK